jgi:hypothetical protein
MMSFFDIDRRWAGMRVRAWLLIVNFAFNAVALFGLSRLMATDTGWPLLIVGVTGTIVCIGVLTESASTETSDGGT